MPPADSAGKNFISVTPSSSSVTTSETVETPGRNGTPESFIAPSSRGDQPGLTRKRAPATRADSTCPGESRVPAPITASGTSSATARIPSSAAGVRSVTSIAGSPPATSARASGTASAASCSTTTGMTAASPRTEGPAGAGEEAALVTSLMVRPVAHSPQRVLRMLQRVRAWAAGRPPPSPPTAR
ncbi:hypothetical protein Srufu_055530 [Streptomyces libani subsp. rufus]|nr:hypothetical protein Srufu_055530 [Streptomyces libani subsp. rufus]